MKIKYLQTIFTAFALILTANLLAQYASDSTKNYYFYTGKMDVYYDSIKVN